MCTNLLLFKNGTGSHNGMKNLKNAIYVYIHIIFVLLAYLQDRISVLVEEMQ